MDKYRPIQGVMDTIDCLRKEIAEDKQLIGELQARIKE